MFPINEISFHPFRLLVSSKSFTIIEQWASFQHGNSPYLYLLHLFEEILSHPWNIFLRKLPALCRHVHIWKTQSINWSAMNSIGHRTLPCVRSIETKEITTPSFRTALNMVAADATAAAARIPASSWSSVTFLGVIETILLAKFMWRQFFTIKRNFMLQTSLLQGVAFQV